MKKLFALLLALVLTIVSWCCCFAEEAASVSDKETIEAALNLANNPDQEWVLKVLTENQETLESLFNQ